MQTEVGVFRSRAAAEQAIKRLLDSGISSQSIIFLSGEQSASELKSVPTTEGERDGMGPAMGAVVGGAVGASAGLSLGTAIASLVVPVSELFSALAWARLLRLAWTAMVAPAALGEPIGWALGAALYPLERALVRRLRESPSTELMVCRKTQ